MNCEWDSFVKLSHLISLNLRVYISSLGYVKLHAFDCSELNKTVINLVPIGIKVLDIEL